MGLEIMVVAKFLVTNKFSVHHYIVLSLPSTQCQQLLKIALKFAFKDNVNFHLFCYRLDVNCVVVL